jgi:hypothetical protein
MDNLASLSIFPATRKQVLESRKRSFASWGKDSTLEEFLARDAALDSLEHAGEKMITW